MTPDQQKFINSINPVQKKQLDQKDVEPLQQLQTSTPLQTPNDQQTTNPPLENTISKLSEGAQTMPVTPNVEVGNENPYNTFLERVQKIKQPDLSSLLTSYDETMNQSKRDAENAERTKKWAALADLGNLVGGYIGARGGANVNVNQNTNTGIYNQAINNLIDTYRKYQSGRQQLATNIEMNQYKNDLASAQTQLKALEAESNDVQKTREWQLKYATLLNNINTTKEKMAMTMANYNQNRKHQDQLISQSQQRNNIAASRLRDYERQLSDYEQRTQLEENKNNVVLTVPDSNGNREYKIPKNKWDNISAMMFNSIVKQNPNAFTKVDGWGHPVSPTQADINSVVNRYASTTPDAIAILNNYEVNTSSKNNSNYGLVKAGVPTNTTQYPGITEQNI